MKLIYNVGINSILINKYENGQYDKDQAKLLTYLNFPQSYVANYNYGNILYQNGEYEAAIKQYKDALKGNIPKYKECSIRINYALAICRTVKVDEENQDSIKNAIETYESAIDVLVEEGCADRNDNNGHSQKAQQLKKDIQKEIDRLKKLQKEDVNKKEDNNKKEDQEEKKDTKTKDETETIEAKIQNIKEEATKTQRDLESEFSNYDKDITLKTKNW